MVAHSAIVLLPGMLYFCLKRSKISASNADSICISEHVGWSATYELWFFSGTISMPIKVNLTNLRWILNAKISLVNRVVWKLKFWHEGNSFGNESRIFDSRKFDCDLQNLHKHRVWKIINFEKQKKLKKHRSQDLQTAYVSVVE